MKWDLKRKRQAPTVYEIRSCPKCGEYGNKLYQHIILKEPHNFFWKDRLREERLYLTDAISVTCKCGFWWTAVTEDYVEPQVRKLEEIPSLPGYEDLQMASTFALDKIANKIGEREVSIIAPSAP